MTLPTIYDGCRGYWSFNEGSGTTTADQTHRRDASISAGAWGGSGKIGAHSLSPANSTDSAIATGVGIDLKEQFPLVSVQGWVNLSMAPSAMWGSAHIICTKEDTGGGSGFVLGFLTGTNAISFRIYNQAGTPYTATYTEAATSGWIHYVGVYTPSAVLLYRNGVQVASAVADGTMRKDPTINIKMGLGFQGLIDEVAIWDRDLTPTEITALYNSGAGAAIAIVSPYSHTSPTESYFTPSFAYRELADDPTAYPAPLDPDLIPSALSSLYSQAPPPEEYAASAFGLLDSPLILQDPVPTIVSIVFDTPHIATMTGQIQAVPWGWFAWWWDFLSPSGFTFEFGRNDKDFAFGSSSTVIVTAAVPVDVSFLGWQTRLTVETLNPDVPRPRRWSSAWLSLPDSNWRNIVGAGVPPLRPNLPGPPMLPNQGLPGPGVYRPRQLDFSAP